MIFVSRSLFHYFFFALLFLLLCGCGATKKTHNLPRFKEVSFKNLEGWDHDKHLRAAHAFLKSCSVISKKKPGAPISNLTRLGGSAKEWQKVCKIAKSSHLNSDSAAKKFFERNFSVYKISDTHGNETGKMTGYYEITLNGSRTPSSKYKYPIYKSPPNLSKLKGKRNFCHKSINKGVLENKKLEIVWVDSAARRFFLHIQGSGIVKINKDHFVRLSYDDHNGFPRRSIASIFNQYCITKVYSPIQMMKWLDDHPALAKKMMEENQSYVFFRENHSNGVLGGQQSHLTPERSLAIDHRIYPYGALFWIETTVPKVAHRNQKSHYNRLFVAQDTGGAIRGPIRGDLFFGHGTHAEILANGMNSLGKLYILVPKNVKM